MEKATTGAECLLTNQPSSKDRKSRLNTPLTNKCPTQARTHVCIGGFRISNLKPFRASMKRIELSQPKSTIGIDAIVNETATTISSNTRISSN
ncbi:hypothetical protein BLOT_006611 [Blomia tropicalis]|nr:hypothetical protein BLOT_006611 [Blomia tropicalis]